MCSQDVRLKNDITAPILRAAFNVLCNDSCHYTMTIPSHTKPIKSLRSTESKSVTRAPEVNKEVLLKYKITGRIELPHPHGSWVNYPQPLDAEQSMVKCWFNTFVSPNRTHYWSEWCSCNYEKNYTQEEQSHHLPWNQENEKLFPAVNEACFRGSFEVDFDRNYVLLFHVSEK